MNSYSALIEFIAIFVGLTYTLNIQLDRRKIFFMIVGIVLPTICVYIWIAYWLGILTLFSTTTILFYRFSNNYRVLLDLCILFIGAMLADHLAQLVNIDLFHLENVVYTFSHSLFFLLIFTVFVYGYKKSIEKIMAHLDIPLFVQILIFIIVSTTIFVFYLNIFIPSNQDEMELVKINLVIQLGYSLLMILLFSLLLYNVKKENQIKQRIIEMEQFTAYMEALEQVNRDMQKFRHDYRNILLTMKGYLDEDNLDDLKEYFRHHILQTEAHTLFKTRVLGNLDHLQLVGLKGLLATKALQADEQGIKISIEIPEVIDNIDMNIIDLTRIMGILLDNAIEANETTYQGEINIAFFKTKSDSTVIIIRNTLQDDSIDLVNIFKDSFSTKGKDRGTGLANIKNILGRYPQVLMNTRIEQNWFIQEIEIQDRRK
ncbi:hypothetical protein CEW92_15420 [Bacillaceae bacterium SAS-127]|nr:hypothetical protein CEW92_15420 [Bacillaceae bacterium SAS-127]